MSVVVCAAASSRERLPRTVCLSVAACFSGCLRVGWWEKKPREKVNKKPQGQEGKAGKEARTMTVSWWVCEEGRVGRGSSETKPKRVVGRPAYIKSGAQS